MSAELYPASANHATLHSATVGGSKPLHRFIRGQPKSVGIVILVLGSSFVIISVAIIPEAIRVWAVIPPGFLLGAMFLICGILYVVAEHNTTKKTVTISLALSIVSLLGTLWTIIHLLISIAHSDYIRGYSYHMYYEENGTQHDDDEILWQMRYAKMAVALEGVFALYTTVGAIAFTIMSCVAGAALRSTKSQAVVVLTAAATEAPVE